MLDQTMLLVPNSSMKGDASCIIREGARHSYTPTSKGTAVALGPMLSNSRTNQLCKYKTSTLNPPNS